MALNISEKKLDDVIDFNIENGDTATCKQFAITPETLARYLRHYENTFKKDYKTRKALRQIGDTFTEKELTSLIKSKTLAASMKKTIKHTFTGDIVTFAHYTDTHIGSKYFDENNLMAAFEECDKYGVDFIVHTGDVTEGFSNRPGHVYELTHIGADQQKEYAIELFSRYNKPIYMIDGNHDRWYIKSAGVKIVKDICKELDHCVFLGHDEGDINVNGVIIKLWHGEDGSCFDDQTEILTKSGWKYFNDLSYSDAVATMTKEEHKFQWQYPTDIINQPYSGDMYHFKSRTIDCMVTPNHGMWTRVSRATTYRRKEQLKMPSKSHRRLKTEWHKKTAEEISNNYSRQKWQFTKHCDEWEGNTPEYINIPFRESKNKGVKVYHFGDVKTELIAELIGWYVTEGHARKYDVCISQYKNVNPINYNEIVELMESIGCKYRLHSHGINIGSAELADWIKKECGHLSRNKYLPQWLKECDVDILNTVIDTMVKGDGWICGKYRFAYKSISKRLLADFAEIAIKCGYSVTYYKGGDSVGITKDQSEPTVNNLPEKIEYTGNIYCCKVPNGLIYVRRNGKTLWTHNSYATSYRIQKLIEAFTGGEKPHVLCCGHTHKQVSMFERNIHVTSGGALSYQSSWMRSKRLACHSGFFINKMCIDKKEVKWFQSRWYPFYKKNIEVFNHE